MKYRLFLYLFLLVSMGMDAQILKRPLPDKLVVLTFDDAPASQYSVVAPLLRQYGFGATFFVCEFPPNYHDSALYMTWRQIRLLEQMGFEIANHTRSHANVAQLDKKGFESELDYIENTCDSLGIAVPTNFAYPGYGLNSDVLDFLEDKGYVFARAGGSRPYDPLVDHPFLIPSWACDETNEAEILEALGQAQNGKITVLTFHGVPDIEHPWVNTPPELFKRYLKYLDEKGYTVVALRDLERYIDVKKAMETLVPDLDRPLKN